LFRGSNGGSLITRTFTGSHFDHVAMVLKFDTDQHEVYLVEATGTLGVALNKWSYLREHIGAKKFYAKCVFRHINFDRSDAMVDNLEKFLKEAVGLKYGLGSKKLLRRETLKKEDASRELIDEERTFFCSELVAKAFKVLGIIKNDEISSAQFYPHHFCMRGDSFLKLTDGT